MDAATRRRIFEPFFDMLHPNPETYAKWAAELTPILDKLGLAK